MTTTPDAPIATPTPEIFDSGPVEGIPGVVIAADAENPPDGLIWVCNCRIEDQDDMIRHLANPTRHRDGMACRVGAAGGTETNSAETLRRAGYVGIYRVDTP